MKCRGVLGSVFNRQNQHISDLNTDLENKLRKNTVKVLAKLLYSKLEEKPAFATHFKISEIFFH